MPIVLGARGREIEQLGFAIGTGVEAVPSPQALDARLAEAPSEELVVIGPDVPLETACTTAERYRVERPALGLVLIRHRPDVATMARAMRAGMREVVPDDDTAEIASACRRSLAVSERFRAGTHAPGASGRGSLIAVFASKGGCGKTTVATNLGAAFAASGLRTCLVDFDLQFGDIAIALQLEPLRSVSDAVGMHGGIDDQAVASLVVPARERLDVLLAPPRPADAEFVTADLAGEILEALLRAYDIVIVDSPPAFNDVVLRTLDLADRYVLITTLDMPALKSLKVTLDTLEALGYPRSRWNIVLNRSDSRVGLTPGDVERAIGMAVPTRIPSSSAVPASINEGTMLVETSPRHPVSRAITHLAATLRAAAPATSQSRRPALARR